MASKVDSTATCPMCFETRPLKIVGKCKHSFCVECLSTVLESLNSESDEFACPTCKRDCPRPWDGVHGLVDVGSEPATAVTSRPRKTKAPKKEKTPVLETEDLKCQICLHKIIDVPAVSYCVKCSHFHFCQDCNDAHAKNKATMNHMVTYLRPTRDNVINLCKTHDADFASYCKTCSKAVCPVCIMLDHGDHDVQSLEETIEEKAEEIKSELKEQTDKLGAMQGMKGMLVLLNDMVPIADRQDILIKDIEDYAQRYIAKIIEWKEDLKTQVQAEFKVVKDIPKNLENMTTIVSDLHKALDQGWKLLAKTEHHAAYLNKILALQNDISNLHNIAINTVTDAIESLDQDESINELYEHGLVFNPHEIPSNFGSVDKSESFQYWTGTSDKFNHTMQVDSEDKFIPCVANLGDKFAVAHPTSEGVPSGAIDIYDMEGTLINTLTDHVAPVYDMSATIDGNLAVLSDGSGGTGRSVKIFDPEAGYMRSTKDVNIARPLSLGVTLHFVGEAADKPLLQDDFVILGDDEQGRRQITVTDKDGDVKHTHVITDTQEANYARRLKCGFLDHFFLMSGERTAREYEITAQGIEEGKSIHLLPGHLTVSDISSSTTFWGDMITVYMKGTDLCCKVTYPNDWPPNEADPFSFAGDLRGVDRNIRVSARGDNIVVSHQWRRKPRISATLLQFLPIASVTINSTPAVVAQAERELCVHCSKSHN